MGMAKIWYNRIYAGTIKLSQVPDRWLSTVESMIDKQFRDNTLAVEEYHRMLNIEENTVDLDSMIEEYINS